MGANYNLYILAAVAGIAGLFMCVYAVARVSGNVVDIEQGKFSTEQLEYMRDVRQRHVKALAWMARPHR